jgi:hypothetical protein
MKEHPEYQNMKKVRTIEGRSRSDFDADAEVNQCLSHGWVLLAVQAGESHHSFVLGWPRDEEPPKTKWQTRIEGYSRAVTSV